MAAHFSTLGALIGLAIAIVLIIRKVTPACKLIWLRPALSATSLPLRA